MVSFTPCSPYPHKEISRHPFFWSLGGLQGQSERFGVEENLVPKISYPKSHTQNLVPKISYPKSRTQNLVPKAELQLVIQSLSLWRSQHCHYAVSVPRHRAATHFCTTVSAGCSKLQSVCGRFDSFTFTRTSRLTFTKFTTFEKRSLIAPYFRRVDYTENILLL